MFKKIFLVLTMSLSFHNIYTMVSHGANAGLNPDPKLNFDKIDLVLDGLDFILEATKIASMKPSGQPLLRCIHGINGFNKFLIVCRYLSKWYPNRKLSKLHFFSAIGCFQQLSECFSDSKRAIKYSKINLSKNKKITQYTWLTINKLLPFIIYTIVKMYLNGGYFGKHLLYTLNDEPSKIAFSRYSMCKILLNISEQVRREHQYKVWKRLTKYRRKLEEERRKSEEFAKEHPNSLLAAALKYRKNNPKPNYLKELFYSFKYKLSNLLESNKGQNC